jgi:hypothetical protein
MSRDRNDLQRRIVRYFDPGATIDDLKAEKIGPVQDMARFDARKAREHLLSHETFRLDSILRYYQRPFDEGWCYYTSTRPIWNEPRPELVAQIRRGSPCLISRAYRERPHEGPHILISSSLPDYHLLRPNCSAISFFQPDGRSNISASACTWLAALGFANPDRDQAVAALPWHHALAIGYAPAWLSENADGIRQDWPRVPLPGDADLLRASAALGARVATLLDPDAPVPGVTSGAIDPALFAIGTPSRRGGGGMRDAERMVTAGWGHAGKDGAVMPGRGRIVTRDYAADEAATAAAAAWLGERTHDVFLNDVTYWRNVPEAVWSFTIGGYQVLKKFLSYREQPLLGRALSPTEVRYVRDVARRLAALRMMAAELDANYRACALAHRPFAALQ